MAIAGVTVAAAVSVGAGVAATWPATSASGAAFAHYAASLDASQRSLTAKAATAPVPDNSVWPDHLGTLADAKRAQQEAVAAQLAAARRRAAARAAARRAAAARAAARRAAAQAGAAQTTAQAANAPSGSPQQVAAGMLASFGWSSGEFGCLDSLWSHESGWNVAASNPSSGAYGIPQALPGAKMASAGADWQTNPATQIKWGLGYIRSTYGSPCAAWSHEESAGWY